MVVADHEVCLTATALADALNDIVPEPVDFYPFRRHEGGIGYIARRANIIFWVVVHSLAGC